MFILKRKYCIFNFVKYRQSIVNHLDFFLIVYLLLESFFNMTKKKMAEVIKIAQRNMDLYVNSEYSEC